MEKTLLILKPDCIQRRLIGRVIQRFEDKGLTIAAMKLIRITEAMAKTHYAPHKDKPFFPSLLQYITSGPVVVMIVAGPNAIAVSRKLMGKTFGFDAEAGTIRGDFGNSKTFNLIHGSDSPESAETEIAIYFDPAEIMDYTPVDDGWISQSDEV